MIELSLFGALIGTLTSALSVVLLIMALTSATYLAVTLATTLRARVGVPLPPSAERRARQLGIGAAVLGGGLALAGLRLGGAGSGGELIPTLTVIIASVGAIGASVNCAVLGAARGALILGEAKRARQNLLAETRKEEALLLEAEVQKHHEGEDIRDEEESAEAGLDRLRRALAKLGEARDAISKKLEEAMENGRDNDLAAEYRRARDEVAMKLELGERVLDTADAAAFRLACGGPLRWLVRRRPRDAMLSLERLDEKKSAAIAAEASADGPRSEDDPRSTSTPREGSPLDLAHAALETFLGEVRESRRALEALEGRRPRGIKPGSDEDPWTLARQDLDAVEDAYKAVFQRVEVLRVRREAQASIEEVAEAAGAIVASTRGLPIDQAVLQDLAIEVTRAETAVVMATPVEGNPVAITRALARCTAALGRSDASALDELLKALRAIV